MTSITTTPDPILGVQVEGEDEIEIIKAEAEVLNQEVVECGGTEQGLAEWYVRKCAELEQQRKTIKAQARKIDKSLAARLAALAWRVGPLVEKFVREEIVRGGGKRKSVKLLSGNTGFRKIKGKLALVDEEAFKDWFNRQPDDIRAELQECFDLKFARKTPVMDYFNANGDIPDGFDFIEEHDKFYPSAQVPALLLEED